MSRELYAWYKSQGICVRCGQAEAARGKTVCLLCMDSERVRSLNYRNTHLEAQRAYCREYNRERYWERKAQGLCVTCGERKAVENRARCVYCADKMRRYSRERDWSNGMMPRHIMGKGDYCYFCGAPVDNTKLCPACLERARKRGENARKYIRRGSHDEP